MIICIGEGYWLTIDQKHNRMIILEYFFNVSTKLKRILAPIHTVNEICIVTALWRPRNNQNNGLRASKKVKAVPSTGKVIT